MVSDERLNAPNDLLDPDDDRGMRDCRLDNGGF